MTKQLTGEVVMTITRKAGRVLIDLPLVVLYAFGWLAGALVVVALTIGTAVRLGWSDARKRGQHGAA